jgi:hypothetical protein
MSGDNSSARAPAPGKASRSTSGPRLRALGAGGGATRSLSVGTRVQLRDRARLKGTVISYHPEYSMGSLGLFSVRLDNAIWQICDASDVIVLAPSKETLSVAIVRTEAAGR